MGAIVGTAGHVDHGKTELVKALTGVDTDRWEEEKRRGLTIDLGFAPLLLTRSGTTGLIDVPGHKDFLRNMLAGMGGVDVALLVISADEGVMPQTEEHFQIIKMFGVKKMVVALTKCDLVDSEIAELVAMDIASLLEGTRFEGSPVVKVSSPERLGLDELVAEIDSAVLSLPEKDYSKPARMPIDRVFTLKGAGTVVTGTLASGKISQGAELVVYPKGFKTRVRQIHVHNEKKDEVFAGSRVALNITGVNKEEMRRGDVIAAPGYVEASVMLDVVLQVLDGVPPIRDWSRVKLYIGSAEVLARTAILGRKEIEPGEEGYVQLRLEQRSVGKFGDRFVIRSYSPMRILGGGVVLDSNPRKHKRSDELVLNILEARSRGDASSVIAAHLNAGYFEIPALRKSIDADEKRFMESVEAAAGEDRAEILGDTAFDRQYLERIRTELASVLEDFHKENPLQKGMSKEGLRVSARMNPQTFDLFLLKSPGFQVLGDRVKLTRMKLELNEQQVRQREEIETLFRESGFSPPSKDEIASRYSNELLYSLVDSGTLIKLTQELVVHREVLERGKSDIAAAVRKKGPLKLTEIKEILNTTRKYAVPVAEYLDRTGFTRREGDLRTLA